MRLDQAARMALRVGTPSLVLLWTAAAVLAQENAQTNLGQSILGQTFVGSTLHSMLTHNSAGLIVVIGLIVFATSLSLLHLRERGRSTQRERVLVAELNELRRAHDRAEMLLKADRQVVVTWAGREQPDIEGDASLAHDELGLGTQAALRRILAFGSWLTPQDAARLEAQIETLRQRGSHFRITVRSTAGRYVEAQGQAVSGLALLRLRETTGEHRELIELRGRIEEAARGLAGLEAMIDAIPHPIWNRGADGSLRYVNAAYVEAVEGGQREATLAAGTELLERSGREALAPARSARGGRIGPVRATAIVAGSRRSFDVTESRMGSGLVGIAVDVTDIESAQQDLRRQMKANERTLDQLPTAIAMFDSRQRLVYHNASYQSLWDLPSDFLESQPLDGEILDRLRAERKLPEQQDFRIWKAEILKAYRELKACEWEWYLPDGRTLDVVADLNPQGGLTYLYKDLSEEMLLHSRFSAFVKERAETLNTLKEPVAVFGADYRITLANRAFEQTWGIHEETIKQHPRVDEIIAACRRLAPDPEPWNAIRGIVTGLSETRKGMSWRLEMINDTVLDCTAQPLPAGATLLTFIDMTASVKAERLLIEKNEVLERVGQLRDNVVNHVSYELRSPLTHIIGFAQLLSDQTVGPLNERQRDYSDHIKRSSSALLGIINDILDLASIDARSLELQRGSVDVRATIDEAVRSIEDRLVEAKVGLDVDVPPDVGSFSADGKRIRQILFNLLANAVTFSEPGQHVCVEARRKDGSMKLSVIDHGRGIPAEVISRVFERFESHTLGTKHRGVGLGLSIVRSFVELHGGNVTIDSEVGRGTRVTCTFPLEAPDGTLQAAE